MYQSPRNINFIINKSTFFIDIKYFRDDTSICNIELAVIHFLQGISASLFFRKRIKMII